MATANHKIRLLGPWQCQLRRHPNGKNVGRLDGDAEKVIINLPVDWRDFLSTRSSSIETLARSFGCPTNLDDNARVELVVTNLSCNASVTLNEMGLKLLCKRNLDTRFDLTNRLERRNALHIELANTSLDPEAADKASSTVPFDCVYIDIIPGE